ncbi:type VI secretion system protein ImpA [Aquabacter spiritensis]|uniref:Type VI secretion system protein ImpA n=2 Tax=Aquabacter spiritensis TaxID=933073 RepID=A0A4R3LPQ0_9HYPH|nr:type VI secretion system protein ImpA [Aquabacter spiritensis]
MKDARANARRKERVLDVDPDSPLATEDWSEVAETGFEILSQVGKDLEVAAWLIEALVRVDGFAGLCTGLVVARGLVANFWDAIYPLPDEDGNEPRLAPFIALNGANNDGTLVQPLRKIPLLGAEPIGLWQYEQAVEVSQISDAAKRDARIAAGALKLEDFQAAVQGTPAGFFKTLVQEIEEALVAVGALSDAFSERVGIDAPPAGAIRNLLTTTLDAVRVFAETKLQQAADAQATADLAAPPDGETAASAEDVENDPGASSSSQVPSGRPRNRNQALQQLLLLAAYFRETEPNSPISYTLEEAVRRCRMPLNELLEELIVDTDARRYFYLAAGLRLPAHDEGESS